MASHFYYDDICKTIAELHENILVTGIVQDGILVNSFFKPLVFQPKLDRLVLMLAQAHIMVNIPKTNEDFFGTTRFTMVYHDNLHTFMFPLKKGYAKTEDNINNDKQYVFVMVTKPHYSFDELIPKVLKELTNSQLIPSSSK